MKCDTDLEAGLKKIQSAKRPGMVIIHKSKCGVCRNLKPKFLASKEINRLCDQFVVISLEDEKEPKDKLWLPDGKYFPRVFFLNPKGQLMKDIFNDGNSSYKYFYPNEKSLVKSMEKVLYAFPASGSSKTERQSKTPIK